MEKENGRKDNETMRYDEGIRLTFMHQRKQNFGLALPLLYSS